MTLVAADPSDIMESIRRLKEAWNIASSDDMSLLDEAAKTELQQNVEALDNFHKTKCKSLDYPTLDTSILEFWGFGGVYLSRGALVAWQNRYPWLDMEWLINTLLFKTKWLVVRKSLLDSANRSYKGGPTVYSPAYLKGLIDSRFIDAENSYRKHDWKLMDDLFTGTYDKESPDVKQLFSGELVVVSRGFCSIGSEFKATPLFPADLHSSEQCRVYYFGAFPSGFFSQFRD